MCEETTLISCSIIQSCFLSYCHITVTLLWAQWRLKSPASRLFAQPFVRAQIKENIKAPRHWTLWGKTIGDRWITSQRASEAENVSIWWRHHLPHLFPLHDYFFPRRHFILSPSMSLFFLPSTVPPNNAECNGLRNLMHIPFHCQLLFPKFKFLPFYRQFFPLHGHFLPHYRHLLPLHRNLFPLYHYFLPPHRQFFPLPYLRLLHQSRSFANTRGHFSHRRPLQDIHKTPVTLFTNMN